MKKLAITFAIVLGMTFAGMAQQQGGGLFERGAVLEEAYNDYNYREGSGLILPGTHGGNDDADAPLGSGIAVLFTLGGVYLTLKKKEDRA